MSFIIIKKAKYLQICFYYLAASNYYNMLIYKSQKR